MPTSGCLRKVVQTCSMRCCIHIDGLPVGLPRESVPLTARGSKANAYHSDASAPFAALVALEINFVVGGESGGATV